MKSKNRAKFNIWASFKIVTDLPEGIKITLFDFVRLHKKSRIIWDTPNDFGAKLWFHEEVLKTYLIHFYDLKKFLSRKRHHWVFQKYQFWKKEHYYCSLAAIKRIAAGHERDSWRRFSYMVGPKRLRYWFKHLQRISVHNSKMILNNEVEAS